MHFTVGNVKTYIRGGRPAKTLRKCLGYFVDGAWYSSAYKQGHWDGWNTFLDYDRSRRQHYFPSGFLEHVCGSLDQISYSYTVEDERGYLHAEPNFYLFDDEGQSTIDLSAGKWYYQSEAVESAMARGRGVIVLPTGGGKTEVAASIIGSYRRRALFLTHRKSLLHQTRERFEKRLGRAIGIIGDSEFNLQEVTVGMVQSISLYEKDPSLAQWLEEVQVLIGDEIHHLESDQWFGRFGNIQAPVRFGLSATPNFEDSGMALLGMTGPIIYQKDVWELIDSGVLVRPRIWFYRCNLPELNPKLRYQSAYSQGIVANSVRNDGLILIARQFKTEGRGAVTLVKRINHGDLLTDLYCSHGIRTEFINGKVTQKKRNEIFDQLKFGQIDHVVAIAEIVGEGFDVPWLDAFINATGSRCGGNAADGETGRQLIQFLGRIIRSYPGKMVADFVDIADFQHPQLKEASHARSRTLDAEGYDKYTNFWEHYESPERAAV